MKKFFILFGILSTVLNAFSQKSTPVAFGIKAGLNLSNQSSKVDNEKDASNLKAGIAAGVFVNIPAAKKFSLQPELLYSQMGGTEKDKETGITASTMFDYITLPVTARLKAGIADFYVGPQVSFLVSAKAKYEGDGINTKIDIKDEFKSTDFSAVAGIDLRLGLGISLDARYQRGFSNLFKDGDSNSWLKNNGFQLALACKLGRHKKQ